MTNTPWNKTDRPNWFSNRIYFLSSALPLNFLDIRHSGNIPFTSAQRILVFKLSANKQMTCLRGKVLRSATGH
jgi:hypothetical protein